MHGSSLGSSTPLVDEEIYEAAISRAAAGASPYEQGGFFYPPTFARAGVVLRDLLGLGGARRAMRAANVLGLVYLLWFTVVLGSGRGISASPQPDRRSSRQDRGATSASSPPVWLLVLLALSLPLLPGVRLGLSTGNFSFLVGALAVFAVWHVDRRPLVSGLMLGSTLLIKPVIAGALPLLLLPRAWPIGSTWLRRIAPARICAAAVATVFASLLLWFDRQDLGAMFATELAGVPKGRSLSIYRFVRELGLGEMRLPLFGLVVAILCAVLWGRLNQRRDLLVGSALAVPLTTLVVWTHTLVMCLPLAALAIARFRQRRQDSMERGGESRGLADDPRQRLEAVLVFGGAFLLGFAHPGGFGDQPGPIQALLLAPFLAAPVALAAYWFRTAAKLG